MHARESRVNRDLDVMNESILVSIGVAFLCIYFETLVMLLIIPINKQDILIGNVDFYCQKDKCRSRPLLKA